MLVSRILRKSCTWKKRITMSLYKFSSFRIFCLNYRAISYWIASLLQHDWALWWVFETWHSFRWEIIKYLLSFRLEIIIMCQRMIKSYAELVVCRALLEMFEASFFSSTSLLSAFLWLSAQTLIFSKLHLSNEHVLQATRASAEMNTFFCLEYCRWSVWWSMKLSMF